MGANVSQASATEFDRQMLITRLEDWLERLVQRRRAAT
jgi:hypothetical protein